MPNKLKSVSKAKPAIKKTLKVNPYKKSISKQNGLSQLSEDIISNISVAIYIVQNGKFVYVSPLFQKLSGYSYLVLVGTNPLDYLHPDDREVIREIAIKSLKEKSTASYEYRFIRKNRKIMWVLERISSIAYKGERAALGSFMDITEHKKMEEIIRQSEDRYRTILENMQEAYYEIDLAGNITFVNDAICQHLRYSKEELIGMKSLRVQNETAAKKTYQAFNGLYRTGEPIKALESEYIRKDGTKATYELSASLIRDAHGKPIGFSGVSRDITERKQMEDALRRSEEKYRTIIETIQDGYLEIDLSGNYTFVNDIVCQHLRYSKEEIIGMNNRQFQDESNAKKSYQIYKEVYATGKPVKALENEVIRKDGTKGFYEASISLMKDSEGKPIGFRCISRDITERKKMQLKIEEMATHDYLTGLPNRVLLTDRFAIAAALARRNKFKLAIMSLDLDKFKSINDTLGHNAGDQVLKVVSTRLTGIIRASDTLARIGGDEFILVLLEANQKEDATVIAQKILNAFIEPFSIDGHQLNLSTSIGIAIYPEDAEDMETLIKKSDAAMYYSKGHGRNQFKFFGDGDVRIGGDHKSAARI
jgi:diguanylate cyclase (GGDEF)-like protein/PAS domain S-box-containing protein